MMLFGGKRKIYPALVGILVLAILESALASSTQEGGIGIEGGEFMMGDTYCAEEQGGSDWCADEIPHRVRVDPFRIDPHEVTNAQYQKCFLAGVCGPNALHEDRPQEFNQPNQPVVFVTWEDASNYCRWRKGRLPTEAEWERAAQGKNPGGAQFGKPYNQGAPRDVGSFDPNSNGLYDMMGNVYEWTLDWVGPLQTQSVQDNPRGPATGKDKVVRGGAWNSKNFYLRVSDRVARSPELRYSDVGLRCVRSLAEKG